MLVQLVLLVFCTFYFKFCKIYTKDRVGGVWGQFLEGFRGAKFVLILFYVNVSRMYLPTFDDTGSLGFPPRRVVYPPGSMVPPWVTGSRFLAGNRKAELKNLQLSFHSYFSVFSCVFSSPDPPAI